jgi:glycyl-tRNA synthetase
MALRSDRLDAVVNLSKRRGFVYPSSEIYGGLRAAWDYGPLGVELKNNVKRQWWRYMVQERDDIVGLDSSVILAREVWEASGHVATFTDPLTECLACHKRFRADHLLEAYEEKHGHPATAGLDDVNCPNCGTKGQFTEPKPFNGMLRTYLGPVEDESGLAFLRPETAQGIFINYKNVQTTSRKKIPFGIGQVGKSFRNEITPGNFIFRTLEFEQMEMEYFVPPAEADQWYRYWVDERMAWHLRYGLRESHLRVRPHDADELSHYSTGTSDIEYLFPIGWSELEGIANRGDFDLTAHAEASGTKLEWVDSATGERFVPHVIEPALGVNRSMLAFLVDAYDEEEIAGRERTVLRLHPQIAPVKAAVLPLIGKDSALVERARALFEELRRIASVEYDDNAQIGRRYRRQDEIGTPFAFTIDEQTLEDDSVTIRDRDSLAQERVSIAQVRPVLVDRLTSDWHTPKPG